MDFISQYWYAFIMLDIMLAAGISILHNIDSPPTTILAFIFGCVSFFLTIALVVTAFVKTCILFF